MDSVGDVYIVLLEDSAKCPNIALPSAIKLATTHAVYVETLHGLTCKSYGIAPRSMLTLALAKVLVTILSRRVPIGLAVLAVL